MTTRTGIYPGTFDPITNGHMDIIRRALVVVDKLIVAVALDTSKAPMFNLETRGRLAEQELASLGKDKTRVEVKTFSGLLVNFARDNKAQLIVRGLRAVSDFEYEFQMACMNTHLAADVETIFLTASESTHFVSSRFVKQICRLGGDISSFVSPNVAQHLKRHFKEHPDSPHGYTV